jgi:hypothetical protein
MIWFDALLEKPANDDLLRRGISALLNVDPDSIAIIRDIAELADMPATCLVALESVHDYSQLISIYHSGDLRPPPILEAATRLALLLERSLLVANDEAADPYSFILISKSGQRSVALVDHDELDANNRYVITSSTPVAG